MGRWNLSKLSGRWCRLLALVILAVFVFDLVIFNVLLFYAYGMFLEVYSALRHPNFMDGASNIGLIRSAIKNFKEGGISNLEQQTLGRLFVMSHKIPPWLRTNSTGDYISHFGVDVSHSGEVTYIMKRMLSKPLEADVRRLVVDIGANDGLLSSNSYNFIQMGWDAVLVEPLWKQLQLSVMNLQRFREPVTNRKQSVQFVRAVIGDTDGVVDLAIGQDAVDMESHLVDKDNPGFPGQQVVQVDAISVATLVKQNVIPKKFALLSIDAEGIGDKILKQFLDLGHRPSYIIYETLHLSAIPAINRNDLRAYGYIYLTHRGWNNIFEYAGSLIGDRNGLRKRFKPLQPS